MPRWPRAAAVTVGGVEAPAARGATTGTERATGVARARAARRRRARRGCRAAGVPGPRLVVAMEFPPFGVGTGARGGFYVGGARADCSGPPDGRPPGQSKPGARP